MGNDVWTPGKLQKRLRQDNLTGFLTKNKAEIKRLVKKFSKDDSWTKTKKIMLNSFERAGLK